jgi:pimeloyl-ACP methyl ester carboxylesterase
VSTELRMRFSVPPTAHGRLPVGGCPIAWTHWQGRSADSVILVHGAGAQMGWWDDVVTQILPELSVVALDLSGHGDSGWRERYSGEDWANEVTTISREVAGDRRILVGHSLGGRVAIMAAAKSPGLVRELVLIDSPGDRRLVSPVSASRPVRRYATRAEAIQGFRLRPAEPVENQALLNRVAGSSYKRDDHGWRLKTDRGVYGRIADELVAEHLAETSSEITEVWGTESSVMNRERLEYIAHAHAGTTHFVPLPGGHNLLFDHGGAIAAVVKERAAVAFRSP